LACNEDNFPIYIPIPVTGAMKAKAFFTTRHGGVSSPPYDTLNLSFQRPDKRENVIENLRRVSEKTGIPVENMVSARQVHGDAIAIVNSGHRGMGIVRESTLGEADGLITADEDVALVTIHADCVPVYLYDPVEKVIALVHSGWRGTLRSIASKASGLMENIFNCRSRNIHAVIGPHIRRCCFEVGAEVKREFAEFFPNCRDLLKPSGEKYRIDLSEIIRRSLLENGLAADNILDVGRCTVCESMLFFSHRAGKGTSGAGAGLFMMVG